MRIPRSFRDRTLLEDEPFASLFLVRSTAEASRSRSGSKFNGGHWTESIIDALKQDGLPAVQAWLRLAFFACSLEDTAIQDRAKHVAPNGDNIQTFIRFYWILFESSSLPDNGSAAVIYLEAERVARGYYYALGQRTEEQIPHAQRVPHSPRVPSETRHNRNRRTFKRLRKSYGEDAYDAEASEGEDDRTLASQDDATDALEPSRQDICIASPPQTVGLSEVMQHVESDSLDLQGDRREEEHSVVLGDKRKAGSDCASSAAQTSPSEGEGLAVAPPHAQDNMMDIDHDALSSLSDLTHSETEMQVHIDATIPADVANIAHTSGRRPRRAASNVERLSYLAKDINKYEGQRSRGFFNNNWAEDTSDDDTGHPRPQVAKRTAPPRPQLAKRSTPLPKQPKRRKHKSEAKSPGTSFEKTSTQVATSADSPNRESVDGVSPPTTAPVPIPSTSAAKTKRTVAKKPKKYAKKGRRGRTGDDLPSRPEKRPRDEEAAVTGT
ncbi:uncharacterized protein B0H18DRAFT_420758 [Fomitopsis serialis]|uniref:uncharacterized protein n=1 Tax=Fomitopsis serialis TaxID=139415 RepID=UPI0020082E46|nr:uncharacterized protein B0H18DRAFT_420758 [Neoantrodia serialis]KAH9935698.1 hypothetical protein B0H18DRAFT_420758 [Neoantrodia serialis]